MLSKNISFLNFKVKNIKTKTNIFIKRNIFNDIKNNKNLLNTLSKNYKYNFKKKFYTNLKILKNLIS